MNTFAWQAVQGKVPVHGELLHLLPGHVPPPQPGQVLHQGLLPGAEGGEHSPGEILLPLNIVYDLLYLCRWTASPPAPSTCPAGCPPWTGSTGPWPWQGTARTIWRRARPLRTISELSA